MGGATSSNRASTSSASRTYDSYCPENTTLQKGNEICKVSCYYPNGSNTMNLKIKPGTCKPID
jgi:hypothetical protein